MLKPKLSRWERSDGIIKEENEDNEKDSKKYRTSVYARAVMYQD
jgi:hypothetical protein